MQTASYYLDEAVVNGVKEISREEKKPASAVVNKVLAEHVKRRKARNQMRKGDSV